MYSSIVEDFKDSIDSARKLSRKKKNFDKRSVWIVKDKWKNRCYIRENARGRWREKLFIPIIYLDGFLASPLDEEFIIYHEINRFGETKLGTSSLQSAKWLHKHYYPLLCPTLNEKPNLYDRVKNFISGRMISILAMETMLTIFFVILIILYL